MHTDTKIWSSVRRQIDTWLMAGTAILIVASAAATLWILSALAADTQPARLPATEPRSSTTTGAPRIPRVVVIGSKDRLQAQSPVPRVIVVGRRSDTGPTLAATSTHSTVPSRK